MVIGYIQVRFEDDSKYICQLYSHAKIFLPAPYAQLLRNRQQELQMMIWKSSQKIDTKFWTVL